MMNYLGRMFRDAIQLVVGLMGSLVLGEQLIKGGSNPLDWAGLVLSLVFLVSGAVGIMQSWNAMQR